MGIYSVNPDGAVNPFAAPSSPTATGPAAPSVRERVRSALAAARIAASLRTADAGRRARGAAYAASHSGVLPPLADDHETEARRRARDV